MNIEIGKTYCVSPVNKKSFVEHTQYARDSSSSSPPVAKVSGFLTETTWRRGTVSITISTDLEREILQDALLFEESCEEFATEDFKEVDFFGCSDVCDEQMYPYGALDEEDISIIAECMSREEPSGFEATDTSYMLYGPLEIEEL